VNLVKKGMLRGFSYGFILDLTIYEAANVVWKEYYLLNKISMDTAAKFIEVLSKIFEVIDVLSVKGLESEVFNIAVKHGLTIYDASYVTVAMRRKLTLVTDDKELRETVSHIVKTVTSDDLTKTQHLSP